MPEQSRNNRTDMQGAVKSPSVDALASQALTLVAARNAKTPQELDPTTATRLRDAAAEGGSNTVPDLIAEMLASGILPETVATLYIPQAARQMGEDWCDDTLSFARVTIGVARLQSSLRTLGSDWVSHGYSDNTPPDAGTVIVVVKDAFHTLGPMVLSGQLRRMGLSVRLALGATPKDLRAIFATSKFDAALISASSSESLDSLAQCVDTIRTSSEVCPVIVIGGNVLDQEADVKAATNADFTTKDPFEALELCGLTKNLRPQTHQHTRRT